jgi:imidazolonepropionase-like amidohydrolase
MEWALGIAIQDIVDAYTINAAFALKQEHTTGSLEPGWVERRRP